MRHSNLKNNKEVIVLKTESEEKQETKDFGKFVTQLTQGYFSELEQILLTLDENTEIREALTRLD